MKLFYSPGSCALAAHIALEEAGARFEAHRLDFKANAQRSPEYLAINPQGLVPLLDDGGVKIAQSLAICEYLDEAYPDTPRLLPAGAAARARAVVQAHLHIAAQQRQARGQRVGPWVAHQS